MQKFQYSRKKVLLSYSLVFIFYYLFYKLNTYLRYPFLRIGDAWFDRKFDDTYQVLNSAKCYATIGRSIYDQDICIYLYGSPLLDLINFIGVHPVNINFIGELFLVINIIIFSYFSVCAHYEYGSRRTLLCILIFISPPFHYLIERGNFDTLIIFLLVVAAACISKGKFLFGNIFLGIASLFKFYTLPVLLIYLLILKFSKSKHLKFHLFLTLIFASLVLRDYVLIQGILGSGTGGYGGTFGLRSFALYANHLSNSFNTNFVFILTMLSFTLIVLVMLFAFKLSKPIFSKLHSFPDVIQLIFGSQIIVCYLITINNDYRLSILGIFLSALLIRSPMNSRVERMILIFGIASIWLSYPTWILQVLGDLLLFITICLMIFFMFRSHLELKISKLYGNSP